MIIYDFKDWELSGEMARKLARLSERLKGE